MTKYNDSHSSSPEYGSAIDADKLSAAARASNRWQLQEHRRAEARQEAKAKLFKVTAASAATLALATGYDTLYDRESEAPVTEEKTELIAACGFGDENTEMTTGFIQEGGGTSNLAEYIQFNLPEGIDRADAIGLVAKEIDSNLFSRTSPAPGEYAVPAVCDITYLTD